MSKPATIRDVAREADVSLKTVSNVLNGTAPVADLTRARVEEVVLRLGYRPNPAARSLRMGRSGVVALAVPDLGRPYFAELADRVLAAARDRRLSVLIEQTNGDPRLETAVLGSARFDHAQGIILALETVLPGQAEQLRLETTTPGRPIVVVGASVDVDGVSSLVQPNESGGFAATEHLIACGSRRIAVVGGAPDDVGPGAGRVAGYLRALEAHGLAHDAALLVRPTSGGFADGAAAIAALVDGGVRFDGVFALSDVLAAGVLAGLRSAGISVPDEVSVVGFDNLDHSAYTTPALTTVDTRIGALATRAVQLVASNREGSAAEEAEHGGFGFALVVRESTRPTGAALGIGAPAAKDWTARPATTREHPGTPRASITMRQVAERAGVSPKTVSDILNGVGSFRDSTQDRVRKAVADLGYRPNQAARSLRSGRTGAYTLAVPELRLPYFAQLASAVVDEARRSGVEILVEPTDGTRESEVALLRSDRLRRTDGMIFAPLALRRDDSALLPTDLPTVVLGDRMRGAQVDSVVSPNEAAAAGAVRHLLDLGRRRIAVIGAHGASPHGTAALRLLGVRSELASAGQELDPELIVDRTIWHRRDGATAAEELLSRGTPFDGLVAFNDMLAVGALRVLSRAGVRVPEDVAVIGFDGSPEGPFAAPPLTSIDLGIRDIARTALAALTARVEGVDVGPGRDIGIGWRLVPRASTVGEAERLRS